MTKKRKKPFEFSSWINPKKMRVAPPVFMWPRYPPLREMGLTFRLAPDQLAMLAEQEERIREVRSRLRTLKPVTYGERQGLSHR